MNADLIELKCRLIELPKKIHDSELKLLDSLDSYDELILQDKLQEANIFNAVEDETTADGKKAFSNDSKRKAETERRLTDDKEVTKRRDEIKTQKRKLEEDKILISYLKRKFRSAEAFTRLINGEAENMP